MPRILSDQCAVACGNGHFVVSGTSTDDRSVGPSAFVAAVFAIHPLRVESVAWVTERKDVLSGLFFMLTLGAYVRYVEQSKTQNPRPRIWYGLTLLSFSLGLLSKPSLITVPFLLLLLDYWPFGRVTSLCQASAQSGRRFRISGPYLLSLSHLLLEKVPFFGLAAASSIFTFIATKTPEPLRYWKNNAWPCDWRAPW